MEKLLTYRQRKSSHAQGKPTIAIETVFIVFHRKNNVWEAQQLFFYILICIDRYSISYDCILLVQVYCPMMCPPKSSMVTPNGKAVQCM